MAKTIAFHRLPGGNPLFLDYIAHFEKVRQFFQVDYRTSPAQWIAPRTVPREPNPYRDHLINGLLTDARRWDSGKATLRHIETLRDPQTLAVVTGQQVGLFGGPLYTFFKATSTVLWARSIQQATGRPTVPIFWMETSDHDFFEVNFIRLMDLEGEEVSLTLSNPPSQKRRIIGTIALNGEVDKLVQRLWTLLPANTFRGPFLEMLAECYHSGATLGDAFARLFSFLFREDGLIIFDAENSECKRAAIPFWDRVLGENGDLNALLFDATQSVHRHGYPPQIQPQEDKLQLFLKVDNARVPIAADGTLLFEDRPHQAVGLSQLRQRAGDHPEDFLPKVSLRPLLQDYLFPTIAYLAGPAEIAYLAQLKPLYQQFGLAMPAIIPRLSITLVEGRIRRILEKYNFTPEELRLGAAHLINELLEKDPTNDLVALFARSREKWQEVKDELLVGLMAVDGTLEHPVEKTMQHWLQGLELLEQKARASLQRKNETLVTQIKKATLNLAPGGLLQERRYGLPFYWARYGRSLAQKIRDQAQIDLYRHQLIYLDEEK